MTVRRKGVIDLERDLRETQFRLRTVLTSTIDADENPNRTDESF